MEMEIHHTWGSNNFFMALKKKKVTFIKSAKCLFFNPLIFEPESTSPECGVMGTIIPQGGPVGGLCAAKGIYWCELKPFYCGFTGGYNIQQS